MLIIRATKGNRNRIDAIFDGGRYLFLNPDMGLVAVVDCNRGRTNQDFSYFEVERSEQISKELIEKVVNENETRFHNINRFIYKNEGKEPMHDLSYNLNIEVLFRK